MIGMTANTCNPSNQEAGVLGAPPSPGGEKPLNYTVKVLPLTSRLCPAGTLQKLITIPDTRFQPVLPKALSRVTSGNCLCL